jgi:hypothetical protein
MAPIPTENRIFADRYFRDARRSVATVTVLTVAVSLVTAHFSR